MANIEHEAGARSEEEKRSVENEEIHAIVAQKGNNRRRAQRDENDLERHDGPALRNREHQAERGDREVRPQKHIERKRVRAKLCQQNDEASRSRIRRAACEHEMHDDQRLVGENYPSRRHFTPRSDKQCMHRLRASGKEKHQQEREQHNEGHMRKNAHYLPPFIGRGTYATSDADEGSVSMEYSTLCFSRLTRSSSNVAAMRSLSASLESSIARSWTRRSSC